MATKHMGLYRASATYHGVKYDLHAKSKKDLKAKVEQKKREIDSGIVSGDMQVSVWANKWFDSYIVPRLSGKVLHDKRAMLDHYILPAIGQMTMRNVRAVHLQSILYNLCCSESYGRKIMQTIKQMFRAARQNKIIPDDPSEDLQLPKLTKEKRRRAITPAERELLTAAALNHRGGCWVMLQLWCGLRPSEAAAVQKTDLLHGNMLHISKAVDRYSGEIKGTKTESGVRDVPIPNALRDFLRQWPYWDSLQPFDYIITTQDGNVLRDGSQRSMWKSIRRDMDICNGAQLYRNAIVQSTLADDFTPYCLRHTYCTDLQAAGVPINVARELMGHSDISVTAAIYTHSSEEAVASAAQKVNNLYAVRAGKHNDLGTKVGTSNV